MTHATLTSALRSISRERAKVIQYFLAHRCLALPDHRLLSAGSVHLSPKAASDPQITLHCFNQGSEPSLPHLWLHFPSPPHHALALWFSLPYKLRTHLSIDQHSHATTLSSLGYKTAFCQSSIDAIEQLTSYLYHSPSLPSGSPDGPKPSVAAPSSPKPTTFAPGGFAPEELVGFCQLTRPITRAGLRGNWMGTQDRRAQMHQQEGQEMVDSLTQHTD